MVLVCPDCIFFCKRFYSFNTKFYSFTAGNSNTLHWISHLFLICVLSWFLPQRKTISHYSVCTPLIIIFIRSYVRYFSFKFVLSLISHMNFYYNLRGKLIGSLYVSKALSVELWQWIFWIRHLFSAFFILFKEHSAVHSL